MTFTKSASLCLQQAQTVVTPGDNHPGNSGGNEGEEFVVNITPAQHNPLSRCDLCRLTETTHVSRDFRVGKNCP